MRFGLIVTVDLNIGQQTQPVASVLIASCPIAKTNIWDVSTVNVYFVVVLLCCCVVVLFLVLMLCTDLPVVPMFLVEYFYR